MKTLLACALLLVPSASFAQTPAAYEATPHGRILACFAQAYSLVELVDVATKNLYLVTGESTKESTASRQQVVSGMLASGTLNDQQQALEVAERLDDCVESASRRAVPDAAAAFAATALREEVAVAIVMADGFASDFRQASDTLDRFLSQGTDEALRTSTNGVFSRFGPTIRARLDRVRLASDELIQKSTPRP
jgi:hypothetical protein